MTDKKGSIRVEDGMAVIRMPLKDAHALRVALNPCPCKAPKSNRTLDIRAKFARVLATLAAKG